MVRDRTRGIRTICRLAQMVLVCAVYAAWVQFYRSRFADSFAGETHFTVCLEFLLLGVLFGPSVSRIRNRFLVSNFPVAHRHAAVQLGLGFAFLSAYLIGSQDKAVPPVFWFSFVPVFYLVLLLTNLHLPPLIGRLLFRGSREERILLVGRSRSPETLQKWLASKEGIGFRVVGRLSGAHDREAPGSTPTLGGLRDLERVIRDERITQVILVTWPRSIHLLRTCTMTCELLGVRLLVVSDLESYFGHSIVLFEDGGVRFVGLREEPLENPFNQWLKRLLDLAVAIPATLFILPFSTALVWILHRLQSPGPVFHRQWRSGFQNRPFQIFKYRSMHLNGGPASVQAQPDDPRVFPAGRWLRRFSIDELPQFYNVLRGEMSVVGPRPHLVEHNEIFAKAMSNYHVRAMVKPGITGLAQVRGFRGGIYGTRDTVDRVNADILYLENWSFALDCWLIFRTMSQLVAPPKSAY